MYEQNIVYTFSVFIFTLSYRHIDRSNFGNSYKLKIKHCHCGLNFYGKVYILLLICEIFTFLFVILSKYYALKFYKPLNFN